MVLPTTGDGQMYHFTLTKRNIWRIGLSGKQELTGTLVRLYNGTLMRVSTTMATPLQQTSRQIWTAMATYQLTSPRPFRSSKPALASTHHLPRLSSFSLMCPLLRMAATIQLAGAPPPRSKVLTLRSILNSDGPLVTLVLLIHL